MNTPAEQAPNSGRWTSFTYSDVNDPWWRKLLIETVEFATGRAKLERLYNEIRDLDVPAKSLWSLGLQQLRIQMRYDAAQLDKIPRQGPLIFVANHPFGLVDGLMMASLLAEVRDEFVFLVNEVLTRDERLAPFLLPIDFRETKEALRTNLESRAKAVERLKAGEALAIFPAGGVATAQTWFGPAIDLEWKNFVLKLIQQSRSTVVPLYFEGQNSRFFQIASQVSTPIRMGLFLYETINKIGETYTVKIGDPLLYPELEAAAPRTEWLPFLRNKVESLR